MFQQILFTQTGLTQVSQKSARQMITSYSSKAQPEPNMQWAFQNTSTDVLYKPLLDYERVCMSNNGPQMSTLKDSIPRPFDDTDKIK